MNYYVVSSTLLNKLQEQVNEMLEKGFKLAGGIGMMYTPNGAVYCQAMIRGE